MAPYELVVYRLALLLSEDENAGAAKHKTVSKILIVSSNLLYTEIEAI